MYELRQLVCIHAEEFEHGLPFGSVCVVFDGYVAYGLVHACAHDSQTDECDGVCRQKVEWEYLSRKERT